MVSYVLDASAVLAVLNGERGAQKVEAVLSQSCMSAVNLAEVHAKLAEHGLSAQERTQIFDSLGIEVYPMDEGLAVLVGELRLSTRHLGLSLGDRSCLALAQFLQATAVTADQAWTTLKFCPVECIR